MLFYLLPLVIVITLFIVCSDDIDCLDCSNDVDYFDYSNDNISDDNISDDNISDDNISDDNISDDSVNDNDIKKYPCYDCGILRSKNEGGTTFTVCDKCWEKRYGH